MVNNQKVFILGMAKSGFAAAKLLASSNTAVSYTHLKPELFIPASFAKAL